MLTETLAWIVGFFVYTDKEEVHSFVRYMHIYAGIHFVFLEVQFLVFIPLISQFPPETTIPLCFGHFYYQHFAYIWPPLLHFAPRFISTTFF